MSISKGLPLVIDGASVHCLCPLQLTVIESKQVLFCNAFSSQHDRRQRLPVTMTPNRFYHCPVEWRRRRAHPYTLVVRKTFLSIASTLSLVTMVAGLFFVCPAEAVSQISKRRGRKQPHSYCSYFDAARKCHQ